MKKVLSIFLSVILLISYAFPSFALDAYSVDGPATVYTAGSDSYQKVIYKLKDSGGNVISDATFSLGSSINGLYMSPNGELRIMGAIADSLQVYVKASYDGNIYQKQITFKTGYSTDFSTNADWSTDSNYSTENGNRYLTPTASSRVNLYNFVNESTYTDLAVEFKYKPLSAARLVHFSSGSWWHDFSASVDSGTATVTLSSLGSFTHTMNGDWIKVKMVMSTADQSIKLYLDDTFKSSGSINTSVSDLKISVFITFAHIDDLRAYSGEIVDSSAFTAEIKNSPVITRPTGDDQTTVTLEADVKENSAALAGHPVNWSLVSAYDGVSLAGDTLTVSSDAADEIEVKASIPGTSKSVTKKFFVLNPGEENLLIIDGATDFTVPLTGTVTQQYTAQDVFGESVSPTWSVSPAGQGVSIDGGGLLTIDGTAPQGTFIINASHEGKNGSFEITTALTTLSIKGDTEIMLPGEGIYVKFAYTLEDEGGTTYPATFSLSSDIDGCFIDQNGVLRLMNANLSPQTALSVIADYGSAHVELPLTFVRGYSEDFTSNYWGSSSNVATDDSGNKYHSPGGARADSPTIMTDPGFNNLTLEFDYKPGSTAQTFNLGGARTPGETNLAKWWMEFKAEKSGDTATVNLSSGSSKIADGISHTMNGDWLGVKITISAVTGDVSLYLDGTHVADGCLTDSLIDFHVKSIISYADIDNVKIYGGEAAKASDFDIEILTNPQAPTPSQATPTVINLEANVKENGALIDGHPIKWTLSVPNDKASISGNVLTLSYGAPSSVDVVAAIPGLGVSETLSLVLSAPDVYMAKTSTGIKFTGTPSGSASVTLYKPLDATNTVTSFLASGDRGVPGSILENHTFTLGADGTYSFDMSSYAPGLYKVYVTGGSVENYMEIIHKFDAVLGTSDALTNAGYENDFKAFLKKYTSMTASEVESAYADYKTIADKQSVIDIAKVGIDDFGLAVMAIEFAESAKVAPSYPASDASNLITKLKAAGYSETAYTLLGKNTNYSAVLGAMDSETFGNMEEYLEDLKNNSILFGIRVLSHVDNGRAFLQELGNSKYNNATYEQQTYICTEVGNRTHASIDALNLAINNLTLPEGDNGGGGAGSTVGSGSVPAGGTSAPGVPVVPPIQDTSIYSDVPTTHWGYKAIETLSKQGIINGSEGKFRPEDNITRAEFVKILAVAFDLPMGGDNAFVDVNASDWFAPYVNAAYSAGLALGSNGQFNPYDNITRQDAALLLYRFAVYAGKAFDSASYEFSDSPTISDYAKEAVGIMAANGFINGMGDGTFAPVANMTRAQAAQLLFNITGGSAK